MNGKWLQFKAEGMTDQGIFTGHASVFGVVDLDNDVVEPGAFAESISTGTAAGGVLIFAQHEDKKEPLGKTLELREDAMGLFVKAQISDTVAGRDYRQLVKDGVLDQMSIGYIAQDYNIDPQGVRHLRKVDLLEISIVNYPANTQARIESYKGGTKPMEKNEPKTVETKEQTPGTSPSGLTDEQLQALLEQAAEAGAAKALKAIAPDEGDETKEDAPADEKADGGEDETKSAEGKGKEAKATRPAAAPAQRKYASIYMNTGAQPKLVT